MLVVQILLAGVAQGCVYGLVALGFVLIYKATETVNFAQGELMMLGAFAGLINIGIFGLPFWLGCIVALLSTGVLGVLLERAFIRPVLGQPAFSIVMVTFGMGYLARGVITLFPGFGTETHLLPVPYKDQIWRIADLAVAAEQVVIIGVTAALCLVLYLVFRYSRVGIAMQAASQNQLAAYFMGIPVQRLNGLVWGLAAMVATVAGILLSPLTFVHAHMGFIGLKAFPAAIVGGFSSLPGAIVGGIIIGVVEAVAGFYLPEGFKDIMPYVVVLLMLMVKPTGLFGESSLKKV